LGIGKTEIFLEGVEASESDGIAVKVVEPVHRPKHGHDPTIKLLHESNFLGIGLLVSTETIVLLSSRDGLLRANILKHLGIVPFVLCGVNVIKLSSHDGQICEPVFR
jgi:hypothetical protein